MIINGGQMGKASKVELRIRKQIEVLKEEREELVKLLTDARIRLDANKQTIELLENTLIDEANEDIND